MKKVLALVLCLGMSFAMVACAGDTEPEAPSSAPVGKFVAPEATTGTIEIEVLNAEVTKDTKDADAVVVTYKFTNNTNKVTTFTKAITATVKQGEKDLLPAIVAVGDVFKDGDGMKNIEVGESIEFQKSFALNDVTTKITASCKILSGEDKKTVTKDFDI